MRELCPARNLRKDFQKKHGSNGSNTTNSLTALRWHGHWIWWFKVYTWQWEDLFNVIHWQKVQLKWIQEEIQIENVEPANNNNSSEEFCYKEEHRTRVEATGDTAEAVSWNNKWQGTGLKEQVEGMSLGSTLIT